MTVYDHPVLDAAGAPLPAGRTVDNGGVQRQCVTFILLMPPKTILHAATLTVVDSVGPGARQLLLTTSYDAIQHKK